MSTNIPVLQVLTDPDGDQMTYDVFMPNGMRRKDYVWALGRLICHVAEEFEENPTYVWRSVGYRLADVMGFLYGNDENEDEEEDNLG